MLTAGTFVFGKITDQHGAPVIGAQITAQPELGAPLEGFTDADGNYRLGPLVGTIELRATAYGHVDAHKSVELAPPKGRDAGEQREDLVLEVADAILAGHARRHQPALRSRGARIEVAGGPADGRGTVTANDGTFTLDMLPRGHLRVRVSHPDYPSDELDARRLVRRRARPPAPRARRRRARACCSMPSSGGPLAVGRPSPAPGPRARPPRPRPTRPGQWKLGPLRAGHWKLDVKLPGYLDAQRELDVPVAHAPGAASVRDIRIDLARGALLGGTVRDSRGQRLAGAHITVARGRPDRSKATPTRRASSACTTARPATSACPRPRAASTARCTSTVRPGDEVLSLELELR